MPPLKDELYYLWETHFHLGSPGGGGYKHLKDIYAFINKYELKINLKNEIPKIFGDSLEIPNKALNVSDYFIFGMMFITTYDILDNIYTQINHISL